jgi:hypothetical protein
MVCKLIYYWFFKSCSIETRKKLNFCRKFQRYLKWDERKKNLNKRDGKSLKTIL